MKLQIESYMLGGAIVPTEARNILLGRYLDAYDQDLVSRAKLGIMLRP